MSQQLKLGTLQVAGNACSVWLERLRPHPETAEFQAMLEDALQDITARCTERVEEELAAEAAACDKLPK